MLSFQRYIFSDAGRTLFAIIATLSVLSLLAQGLTYIEIIRENRQSVSVYLKIILLGAPKVLALLTPLALFVASVWSLNRIHKDSEIIVVQATGMTHWQVASPLLRLAACVMVIHLGLNLWGQPAAQRELRETLIKARTDLATTLIKPGQFTTRDNLTFFARERAGNQLLGIIISDASQENNVVDYLAHSGRFTNIDGKLAFLMSNAQIHQKNDSNDLSVLELDLYKYDLSPLLREEGDTILKASDRSLAKLIRLDPTSHHDSIAADEFLAEAHNRLSTPLLNLAMVLLAIWAILGADYNKLGYGRRIIKASVFALLLLILHIVAHSEAENTPRLNALQWMLPLGTILGLGLSHFIQVNFLSIMGWPLKFLKTSRNRGLT